MAAKGGPKLVPDGESSRQISLDEVKKHSKPNDAWVIIHGKVYDVTKFLRDHPGGPEILQQHAGTDATADFEEIFHSEAARLMLPEMFIGRWDSFKGDWDEVNKRGPKTNAAESSSMNSVYIGGALILVLALLAYYFQVF